MGFNRVYKSLQEIFPQIDARALRAVAIEHSKDADAAVEAVIEEIIPFFAEQSRSASFSTRLILRDESRKEDIGPKPEVEDLSAAIIDSVQDNGGNRLPFHNTDKATEPCYDMYLQHEENDISRTKENVNMGVRQIVDLNQEMEKIDGLVKNCSVVDACESSRTESRVAVSVQDATTRPSDIGDPSVVMRYMPKSVFDNSEVSFLNDATASMENAIDTVAIEDNSTLNATCPSSQVHPMDVLDKLVADARNNKTTMFSAVESIINMMRKVELKEQAVEQTIVEASSGGADTLDKIEELRRNLQKAKEENVMNAGEVYGEKAILATELSELQSRLLGLSEERDKFLALLDEMHQILEMRLAAAENEIERAEQEKLENQKRSEKALADQEMLMEKVIQESNVLKCQAEENAKLREFLMDGGCVVDMLQGEMAVIYQDVKLLKEKLDEGSRSRSSSQISSLKNLIPDLLLDDTFETQISAGGHHNELPLVEEEWDLL